ncbi:hypothetical protein BJX76DRAFT_340613 [Aspergillus varians]
MMMKLKSRVYSGLAVSQHRVYLVAMIVVVAHLRGQTLDRTGQPRTVWTLWRAEPPKSWLKVTSTPYFYLLSTE